jgi:hypothetical protein
LQHAEHRSGSRISGTPLIPRRIGSFRSSVTHRSQATHTASTPGVEQSCELSAAIEHRML